MTNDRGFVKVPLFLLGYNAGRNTLKVVFKVWLDNNGQAFGKGPYELLKGVEETDSLHQAANQLGMSYSKAWKLIQTME